MSSCTRLVTLEDASALAGLITANRAFLEPWSPRRDEEYFTVDGQRDNIQGALEAHSQGKILPHLILDDSHRVVGAITLNGIVRGPLESCSLGYWVGEAYNGRGLATRAVGEILTIAFDQLGLHRVQAETLLHNFASQKVLERHGFVRYGMAPKYLHIGGAWQDHIMFQKVNDEHRFED